MGTVTQILWNYRELLKWVDSGSNGFPSLNAVPVIGFIVIFDKVFVAGLAMMILLVV